MVKVPIARTAKATGVTRSGVSKGPTSISAVTIVWSSSSGMNRYSPGLERSSASSLRATCQAPRSKPGWVMVI